MMKNETPKLSIVTPAYNRGHLLGRCYESLLEQTCFDFEWIVVDDGSTDDTRAVMQELAALEAPFPVCFVSKENGGKHTALNAAHPHIRGSYVLILDSDDYLTPNAVETVLDEWRVYADDPRVGIVIFLRQNPQGEPLAYAKDERLPVDLLRYKRVCVHSGDCCEVIRTELFKKYPFPVFEGERFLAETALWYRSGLDGSCVYINKPVYVCEYLEGGLTQSGKRMRLRNPRGGMYTSWLRMHRRCRVEERIRAGLLYVCYARCAGENAAAMLKKARPHGLLTAACLVPGTLMHAMWREKYLRPDRK